MAVKITYSVTSDNPNTIWKVLARRLGREPTTDEAIAEVKRILRTPSADVICEFDAAARKPTN